MSSFFRTFKTLDIYRELPKDLTEQTVVGATMSVISLLFILFLLISEIGSYLTVDIESSLFVDVPIGVKSANPHTDPTITIQVNITAPAIPCAVASLDVEDIMGTHVVDVGGKLHKSRTDADGNIKRDALGQLLPEHTPNPQDQRGEGCNIHGTIVVSMVPGNFHISAHGHPELLSAFVQNFNLNVSHVIHSLYFGVSEDLKEIPQATVDPLKNTAKITHPPPSNPMNDITLSSYEYYIKVVPTQYEKLNGELVESYQYTANSHEVFGRYRLPAAYFRYDFSPITMKYTAKREPFAHFIVQVSAIIGGVFTVIGLVSAGAHSVVKKYKLDIGKLG